MKRMKYFATTPTCGTVAWTTEDGRDSDILGETPVPRNQVAIANSLNRSSACETVLN